MRRLPRVDANEGRPKGVVSASHHLLVDQSQRLDFLKVPCVSAAMERLISTDNLLHCHSFIHSLALDRSLAVLFVLCCL